VKISYSQFGEDIILEKLLPDKGMFVDVGAYHPIKYSNTFRLYLRGWRGLNIDPCLSPLFNIRLRDISARYAIGEKHEEKKYYMFSHSNWNTFDEEMANKWRRKKGVRYLGSKMVKCLPLRELTNDANFLNIDAEGMDLEVLKSCQWRTYPKVVAVEDSEGVREFMEEKYNLYAFIGKTLIYTVK